MNKMMRITNPQKDLKDAKIEKKKRHL
jgi:hypothetical protein